ncbi:TPA: rod shape-determining protein MreD [Enterobacter cloacae]
MSNDKLVVCGIDIGYSNVKIAVGDSADDKPTVSIYPAYATNEPVDDVRLVKRSCEHEVLVYPGGKEWRAFTERPDARELHDRYHMTEMYLALYLASLDKITAKAGNEIDLVVTGLPVRLANESERAKLTARLTGTFTIAPGKTVTVKKCLVLQQGVGVINDIVNRPGLISQEELEKSTILVVDPGFFSMDYIAFKSGSRVSGSSGSSLKATSAIIESIVNRLNADNPEERIDDLPEIIEIALRNNEQSFYNGFRHISLRPLLEEAIPSIASDVVKELRKSTRVLGPVHIIAAAGGGTRFYEQTIREEFPRARIVSSPLPVASNAIGFWNYGVDLMLYGDD